jgi:glycosyltransferase involved in cell wall biosynthesis
MSERAMARDNDAAEESAIPDRGALDGRTIVRFAHAYSSGGGVERYLGDLDSSLLKRNAMTIIRIFFADSTDSRRSSETLGRGTLLKIPLPLADYGSPQVSSEEVRSAAHFKAWFRNVVLYNPAIWALFTSRKLERWTIPRRPGEVLGGGLAVRAIYQERDVDLTMLHFFGGSDAEEIIDESRNANVPFALLNHFANDRFLNLAIRKHVMRASGISGVSGTQVPSYLKAKFCDLSDGIDVEFFVATKGKVRSLPSQLPLVLLPARIVRSKGHLDLVKAVAMLRDGGIGCNVGFAGRSGTPDFDCELRREISAARLEDCIHFLGELSVEGLRDWYKTASVVAFPTYHHEGLPRVLLEAQAMRVPVVAYSTGGTSGGMISDKTGFLLKTGDIQGLADNLRILLKDHLLRSTMGLEGEKLVRQRFSLKSLAERHEEFYLRVMSKKKSE